MKAKYAIKQGVSCCCSIWEQRGAGVSLNHFQRAHVLLVYWCPAGYNEKDTSMRTILKSDYFPHANLPSEPASPFLSFLPFKTKLCVTFPPLRSTAPAPFLATCQWLTHHFYSKLKRFFLNTRMDKETLWKSTEQWRLRDMKLMNQYWLHLTWLHSESVKPSFSHNWPFICWNAWSNIPPAFISRLQVPVKVSRN